MLGLHDNFFELGGHSLLAVRVIAEINKTLSVYVNVPQFFQNPTIERLASSLEQEHHVRPKPRVLRLQPGHAGPPLYFIGAGPVEIRIAKLMGEDRAVFGTDVPMPMAWRRAMANSGSRRVADHGTTGRAPRRCGACACRNVALRGCRIFLPGQGGSRSSACVAACRRQPRVGPSHRFNRLDWDRPRNKTNGVAEFAVGLGAASATGTADDTPYIKSLSASLRNSWRLLRWLLAQAPPGMKRRFARARSP